MAVSDRMKNPYDVLGVEKGAGQADIKKAYRTLAKELHPDVNPGDKIVEQRFKEVTAAYHLLSDASQRQKFDRGEINADGSPRRNFGFGGRSANSGASGGYGGGGFGGGGFGGFEADADDLFGDLFGRRRGARTRTASMRGKDVSYTVRIPFEEAALGVRRRIKLYDGKTIDVDIPPGTENGQTLRLKQQGMPGMGGGEAGDAFVEVQVDPHKFFERDGLDIFVDVPVTLGEAVLGAKITVPTIHGTVNVTVPRGANTGTSLRLKGKGISPRKGGPGDQYIKLKIMLPDKPDPDLIEFVENWSKDFEYDVRRKSGLID
ncbi:MAG: DnaJ C-terminal domain-containing protein [Alphaproteobacteria bacterium]